MGSVEGDASPRSACRRELAEELGLDLEPGRLMCLEWQGPEPDRTESSMFRYDGGVPDWAGFTLPPDGLEASGLVAMADLDDHLSPRVARRLRAALVGLAEGRMVEMKCGEVPTAEQAAGRVPAERSRTSLGSGWLLRMTIKDVASARLTIRAHGSAYLIKIADQ